MTMMTTNLEQLTRRLSAAKQELTRVRTEIGMLRQQCRGAGRVRLMASGGALLATVVMVSLLSSSTTQAQAGAQQLVASDKEVPASNRGVRVFNGKGDIVVRLGARNDDGYVAALQKGNGTALGGVNAVLFADNDGTHLGLSANNKKVAVHLARAEDGLLFFDEAGTARARLNKANLVLANKAGDDVVNAGTLPDGRGVVRTGPRNGGSLGMGAMNLPFAIMGHK